MILVHIFSIRSSWCFLNLNLRKDFIWCLVDFVRGRDLTGLAMLRHFCLWQTAASRKNHAKNWCACFEWRQLTAQPLRSWMLAFGCIWHHEISISNFIWNLETAIHGVAGCFEPRVDAFCKKNWDQWLYSFFFLNQNSNGKLTLDLFPAGKDGLPIVMFVWKRASCPWMMGRRSRFTGSAMKTRVVFFGQKLTFPTVDGQNPAPPRMMIIPLFIGFSPS